MAITSLILGILGIFSCGLTAVIGLVLGIVAMRRVAKSNGELRGQGIALAGTIVSAVFLFLAVPLGAAMLLPALAKAKERAQSIQCVNNLKQLSMSAFIYADSHDGHLPPTETWADELAKLSGSKRVLVCPAAPAGDECDYAINSQLAGAELHKAHSDTVLFFETANGSSPSGGTNLMLDRPRHGKTINVAFADGHIEAVKLDRLASLRWEP
jgi:prepilin-type processing-associated H-X9-DG protein